jgi:hypothetical protein
MSRIQAMEMRFIKTVKDCDKQGKLIKEDVQTELNVME